MIEDATKNTIIDLTGYLDIADSDTRVEFLSDGCIVSLSKLLCDLDGSFVHIKIETTKVMR